MMIQPSIVDLMKKVDSKYTLVILASKRARMLNDGEMKLTKSDSNKAVSIAIEEIYEGKISYRRNSNRTKPLEMNVPSESEQTLFKDGNK